MMGGHWLDSDSAPMLPPGKCQCSVCGRVFRGVRAFDAHKTGPMAARRCKTPEEMRACGLDMDTRGFWGRDPCQTQEKSG